MLQMTDRKSVGDQEAGDQKAGHQEAGHQKTGDQKTKAPSRVPKEESFTLTDLEQVKVLADPLRVRILEALGEERTTKQVAAILGEKPTRLYHHVEALERVGVIELTRTQQNRGTLEKYYLSVAKSFRADPGLFSQAEDGEESLIEVVTNLMDQTAADLRKLVKTGLGESLQEEGVLSYVKIFAPEEKVLEVRSKLMALLEELTECGESESVDENDREYRLTIAYFPLDAKGDEA